MKSIRYFITAAHVMIAVSYLLFTFTQIDLSLTLSSTSILQSIQTAFQSIGFYNRPLATGWFILTLTSQILLYLITIQLFVKQKLFFKNLVFLVSIYVGILLLSYPAAFSYDIYNYIFTAKSVVLYWQNPYGFTPVEFQGIDSMLSFMRWTHLPSAYTPAWIMLSIPFYILSTGKLLFAMWSIRLLSVISYVGIGVCLWNLATLFTNTRKHQNAVAAAFLLHPLSISELLISGHNDGSMMFLALVALWFMYKQKYAHGVMALATSVALKFITIVLIPGYVWLRYRWVFVVSIIALLLVVSRQREILPWYGIWLLPFTVLLLPIRWLQITVNTFLFSLLLKYAPVLYYGNYDDPTILVRQRIDTGTFIICVSILFISLLGSIRSQRLLRVK